MKTVAELTKPITREEATAAIYAALAAEGVNVTLWKAGAPLRTLIAGLAIVLAALSTLQSRLASMSFSALARGSWLTLIAYYVYNVERDPGSFATGSLTLTNSAGGVWSFDPFEATFTNGSKTYRNVDAIALSAMSTQTITIQATEIGSDSSAGATTITGLVTPMPGVTCSNAAALIGSDEESDETLRLRCSEKLGTLSPNGPRDAYAYVARSAKREDGSSVGVNRIRAIPDGIGGIDLYLATSTGGITGTVGDIDTDIGLVDELLQTQVVPLAVTLRSHTATAKTITATYELWIPASVTLTDDEVKDAVEASMEAFVSTRPIGGDVISPASGKVYKSAIENEIGNAIDGTIKRVVTLPASDVDVTPTQCPVLGVLTCTAIHRVPGDVL